MRDELKIRFTRTRDLRGAVEQENDRRHRAPAHAVGHVTARENAVLDVLRAAGRPLTIADLAAAMERSRSVAQNALINLALKGRVTRHPTSPPTFTVTVTQ